jgi:hypothetical protein
MDDLTKIKGVGPVLAKQLADAGITSFDQLKALDPADPPAGLSSRVDWVQVVRDAEGFGAASHAEKNDATGDAAPGAGGGSVDAALGAGIAPAPAADAAGDSADGSSAGAGETGGAAAAPAAPAPDTAGGTGDRREGAGQATAKAGGAIENAEMLAVTGPKRGRWRAGRHFGSTPVVIALADLSDDDIAALQGDPALTITVE